MCASNYKMFLSCLCTSSHLIKNMPNIKFHYFVESENLLAFLVILQSPNGVIFTKINQTFIKYRCWKHLFTHSVNLNVSNKTLPNVNRMTFMTTSRFHRYRDMMASQTRSVWPFLMSRVPNSPTRPSLTFSSARWRSRAFSNKWWELASKQILESIILVFKTCRL